MWIPGLIYNTLYVTMDGGLLLRKPGGLFRKIARRRGMDDPGPHDRNRTTQIRHWSIWTGTRYQPLDLGSTVRASHDSKTVRSLVDVKDLMHRMGMRQRIPAVHFPMSGYQIISHLWPLNTMARVTQAEAAIAGAPAPRRIRISQP
jgi:hypothetical protein